jgi:hypothetical protein
MDSGTVKVDGTLDASAPNGGDGGFIDTSGAHVVIDPSVKVTTLAAKGKTGTWLIDPNDYTIAASGGDITGTLLSSQLGSNNILILSSAGATAGNGDIFVNDAVSWAANTTLTLSAYRNIEVNADITATGNTAGLTLTPGTGTTGDYNLNNGAKITLPGSAPSLTIAGHVYTVINDVNTLQAMNANVAGYYALGSDIDASVTSGWNGGLGFVPVGRYPSPFVGTLDGANHQILNLVINRPAESSILGVGLFGYVVGGWVQNLEMVGGNITGSGVVGAIAGSNQGNGLILNVRSSATITGISSEIGGIVGNNQGRIAGSYTTGAVVGGNDQIGGLVGANYGTVLRSFATGSISGRGSTGGLVGSNAPGGSISDSYATGSVTGTFNGNVWGEGIGGLAGTNSNGTIANAYSTGFVTFNAGYSGSGYGIGGLVGAVNTNAGGGTTTNSYWDTQTSGQTASAGGAARSTAQMKQQATFVGWDFQNIWSIQAGAYPQLRPVTSGNHLTPPPTTTNPVVPGAPEHGYDGAVDSAHGGNSNHHGEDNNGRHKGNAYAFGKSKHKDRDERSGNDERDEDLPRNFEQGSKMQLSGLPIALEGSGVHLPVVAEKRGE